MTNKFEKIGLEFMTMNTETNAGNFWIDPVTKSYYYDFEAANSLISNNPEWRLPSKEDFEKLINNYSYKELINMGFDLGGYYYANYQSFLSLGSLGYYWSSSSGGTVYTWVLKLVSNNRKAYMYYRYHTGGHSVRLCRDI